MSSRKGRSLPISPFRRLVTDLMHFSAQVPSVTIDRRMKLAARVAARRTCQPRPSWTAIFTKAFATIAARTPELRTSYMRFPWARLYEHPINIVTMNFERLAHGEKTVLQLQIRTPESRSLEELDAIIGRTKEEPVENIKSYRRCEAEPHALAVPPHDLVGRPQHVRPPPCRQLRDLWRHFGGAQGAGVLHLIPLLTSTIHYGLFDETGHIDMRMSFDHRVLDGATAARALIEMEETLLTTILKEIEQPRASTGREQAA